ncbi:MAG: aldo/keto reductase [Myxococcota bacterium]
MTEQKEDETMTTAPIDQPKRPLGQTAQQLPLVGLGCMGMSDFYGDANEATNLETLNYALDIGVTHWDTADMYGPFTNERLLSKVLAHRRDEVCLATKFGIMRNEEGEFLGINGKPAYVQASCDASLKRLGIDQIDLYYQHRPDPEVPITETVGAMAELVKAGKVAALGLSECSAEQLRAAHAVHPIAAYQGEYSIWTRVHEGDVLDVCAELGITYVAYSPLGRGFLTGAITSIDDLAEDDWRRNNPRFSEANFQANLKLVAEVRAIAEVHGCTPAQVALAWVLARHERVVTIPGTTKKKRVAENAQATQITLSSAEMERLAALPEASGARYG